MQVANPLPINLHLNDIAVAVDGTFSFLTKLSDATPSIGAYVPSKLVTASSLAGSTCAGARSFDIELGAGRILMVWAAYGREKVSGGTPLLDGDSGDHTLAGGFGRRHTVRRYRGHRRSLGRHWQ